MTFGDVLDHWALVVADLASEYEVDVYDDELLRARPWSWLRGLILGLLAKPAVYDVTGTPRFATRIQDELWSPPPESEKGRGHA